MSAFGIDLEYWRGRKVFVTGHTGFMGGWLCLLLSQSGAKVSGYALDPSTDPSFFEAVDVEQDVSSTISDIRDGSRLADALRDASPEIVFHLAAQPLVRTAFAEPIETYSTNVMGTANLLEAVRACDGVRAVIVVTTDKVYENKEWAWGYRENDRLGGREPYGTSKACTELVVDAYRESYLLPGKKPIGIVTVRAGNIIGGGDWAVDRLIPDAARHFSRGKALALRNPGSVRPWQHVLEPVRGMTILAQRLVKEPRKFSGPWNLGPAQEDARPVEWVIDKFSQQWGAGAKWSAGKQNKAPYEAGLLMLDSAKARTTFDWCPIWRLDEALERTADWYRAFYKGDDVRSLSLQQLNSYLDRPAFTTTPANSLVNA